jgi:CDP-diacylglycerol--serine O-phosphatidyltransferase
MKQIPNVFTLLNLVFGCLAIISILQNGLTVTMDENGTSLIIIPEKIYLAAIFIGCAAVIDFLDGFVARLLNASSEMGKQLDSLADVVSFGVAPGLIVYQFLRLSFAQQEDGLDVNSIWLLPALLIPCAGAYRLARFNIDEEQAQGFKGVPIPAAGLLIAAFPLIYWYSNTDWIIKLLLNKWFWYAIVFCVCYLMISVLPMMALKFTDYSFKKNSIKYVLIIISVVVAVLLQWLAVPIIFLLYVVLSLAFKSKQL